MWYNPRNRFHEMHQKGTVLDSGTTIRRRRLNDEEEKWSRLKTIPGSSLSRKAILDKNGGHLYEVAETQLMHLIFRISKCLGNRIEYS